MVTRFTKVKIHKFICFCLASIFCLFLCACDPSYEVKPSRFNYTKWTCKEYDTYVVIINDEKVCTGIVNGEVKDLYFIFASGNQVQIHLKEMVDKNNATSEESKLWSGKADYSETEFVLRNSTVNLGLFEETELPVTFIREDLTEEEAKAYLPEE